MTSFAKYADDINKNGEISIAKWDVSVGDSDIDTINVLAGNTTDNLDKQTYTLNVTSESEVGVDYTILLGGIPTGVKVILDGVKTYSEENNIVVIDNAGTFDAVDYNSTHTHSLTFVAPDGVLPVFNNEVSIDVLFVQKDL